MNIFKYNAVSSTVFTSSYIKTISLACAIGLSACGGSNNSDTDDIAIPKTFTAVVGSDLNAQSHPLLSLNPGGPGGSPNQSLRATDALIGSDLDEVMIGGLGADVLLGYEGDDILIGGTEDFNSSVDGDNRGADNRDRALGYDGDDTFIWAPGDGSDFFDGGDGVDVVIFGVLGEATDSDGSTQGAPFFNVNPPNVAGSQDFDGIYLDQNSQPRVRVSASPGFCSVLAKDDNQLALEALGLDNVVRFSLRALANQFDAQTSDEDDGLRVAVSLKNTEFLVCTQRVLDDANPQNNIQVLDISGSTPIAATVEDLPAYVRDLLL